MNAEAARVNPPAPACPTGCLVDHGDDLADPRADAYFHRVLLGGDPDDRDSWSVEVLTCQSFDQDLDGLATIDAYAGPAEDLTPARARAIADALRKAADLCEELRRSERS